MVFGPSSPGIMPDGTALLPGLHFSNDPDTGLYRLGANSVGLVVGGVATRGITIDSAGKIGIGTITPAQLVDLAYGHLRFSPITAPGAPTIASISAGGAVDAGDHYYRITFVTATGETELGTASLVATTAAGNLTVNLSNIPLSAEPTVTQRKIYRTKAGVATAYFLVDTIPNNTVTIYADVKADAALGAADCTVLGNSTSGRLWYGTHTMGRVDYENCAWGYDTMTQNPTNGRNTALGTYALELLTTGEGNVALGTHALDSLTTGSFNFGCGFNACADLVGGTGNIGIGTNALEHAINSDYNIAIGTGAMHTHTATGHDNIAIGYQAAMAGTLAGIYNVAIGTLALNDATSADHSVAIGYVAAENVTTGDFNIAVSGKALQTATTGKMNIAIGYEALNKTNGNNSVAIGIDALFTNTLGGCVALGFAAGFYETEANKLFIDNAMRASEADGRAKALIYGVFGAAVANQSLTFNAGSMGFFGHIAAAQPAAYTVTDPSVDRALDVDSDNLAQVAAVLGTLIADLQSVGLLQ